jgi:hypothetical protein
VNKYYTPTKEDFHIGFEFQIYEDFDYYDEPRWVDLIYGDHITNDDQLGNPFPIKEDRIRVKKLDQDDLRELGFRLIRNSWYEYSFKSEDFLVEFKNEGGEYRIFHNKYLVFRGYLKNKSELKTVLRLVGYDFKSIEKNLQDTGVGEEH